MLKCPIRPAMSLLSMLNASQICCNLESVCLLSRRPMRLFLNMTVCTNWQFLRAGKFIAGPSGHGRTLRNTPSQSTTGAGVLQYLPTGYSIDGAHLTQFFREAHSNAAATGSASWLPCVLAYLSTHQMAAHDPLKGHSMMLGPPGHAASSTVHFRAKSTHA